MDSQNQIKPNQKRYKWRRRRYIIIIILMIINLLSVIYKRSIAFEIFGEFSPGYDFGPNLGDFGSHLGVGWVEIGLNIENGEKILLYFDSPPPNYHKYIY